MLTTHDRLFLPVDRSEPGHGRETGDADSLHAVSRMQDLLQMLMRSITWDRGAEMARHLVTTAKLGAPIYFSDSRSAWQRGSDENTYWCTVLEPDDFDGSDPVSCSVTRKTRAVNGLPMVTVGFDPHKHVHVAVAVDARGNRIGRPLTPPRAPNRMPSMPSRPHTPRSRHRI